jgi:hypothetical protein
VRRARACRARACRRATNLKQRADKKKATKVAKREKKLGAGFEGRAASLPSR